MSTAVRDRLEHPPKASFQALLSKQLVIVSTSDVGHGAGLAAYRLHLGLRRAGLPSDMLVAEKLSSDPHVHAIGQDSGSIDRRLRHRAECRLNSIIPQNAFSPMSQLIVQHRLLREASLVHLHNIHWHANNLSPWLIPAIPEHVPIVWTFHDMWPLTGHCIYAEDCSGWRNGCGDCPKKGNYVSIEADATRELWLLKQELYRKRPIVAVSPSRWLATLARQSPLFRDHRVETIPNGIDQEQFRPLDKHEARRSLHLPRDGRNVVAFVAADLGDARKGYVFFEKALLSQPQLAKGTVIVVVGHGSVAAAVKRRFTVRELGFVKDPAHLATIYSAADVSVAPSLEDNLPNSVLESLACGACVVGFNTGGIPDMVHHLESGFITERYNAQGLAAGISYVLADTPRLRRMQAAAVETVTAGFSQQMLIKRHVELYAECLAAQSFNR
jgi:glycosyltransferase involved in cell wall biosynthesis